LVRSQRDSRRERAYFRAKFVADEQLPEFFHNFINRDRQSGL